MYNIRDAIAATELNVANVSNVKPAVSVSASFATFELIDTSIPVVTLSKENDNKLLEQLKSRFKRTVQ